VKLAYKWFLINILISTTVFKIDNNNKMFLEHQIILEGLLNVHVTLKTEVMTAGNSALPLQEYLKIYIKIENQIAKLSNFPNSPPTAIVWMNTNLIPKLSHWLSRYSVVLLKHH